ncbi:MAG: HAD-IA family hydrolase [Burkholderiales bacterium]|jgi:phosphoglycolate phosphatase|nr:HAD-IA family hydrolase [Burkholderiales bacterium]
MVRAVLFDLDGTFADTAPDLGGALNRQRAARGLAPLPLETIRPHASAGARGLLKIGFDRAPGDPDYDAMRDEFLALYEASLCRDSRLFAGIPELVAALEARGLSWGIVTNKAARFTLPLLDALGVRSRAGCVVSGDTCAQPKPHPAPLFAASAALDTEPGDCIYVGDDERDTQASLAAGMRSVVARYGYLGGRPWEAWGAHAAIETPLALLDLLGD